MTNVHKFGSIKNLFKFMNFNISTHKTTHPVISNNNWRKYFKLAKCLKAYCSKEYKLTSDIKRSLSIVRSWKQLRVMKPNIINSAIFSSMYSELMLKMSSKHFNVSIIRKPIFFKISCFFFFIIFIIRSNDINLLSKFYEFFC